MKRIIIVLFVISIFIARGAPQLHAKGCSNASLQGAYGFYSVGTVLPARRPRVVLGREVYDGRGSYSNTLTINDNGTVARSTNSGTYTGNADCTGTIITTLGTLKSTLDFVLVDGSNEIYFIISSDPAALVVYGVRKKMQSTEDDEGVNGNSSKRSGP